MKVTKLWDFDKVLRDVLWRPQEILRCFSGFFVLLFWAFYRGVWCSCSVHAFMLSWSSWTATWKGFFRHKIVFCKEHGNLILPWWGQTDPWNASADRRMISIVGEEEFEKRKASWIPQIQGIIKHIVGSPCLVWIEWEAEHNDFIVGDSETVPQVNPAILNITDKGELKYWLSKFVVEV